LLIKIILIPFFGYKIMFKKIRKVMSTKNVEEDMEKEKMDEMAELAEMMAADAGIMIRTSR